MVAAYKETSFFIVWTLGRWVLSVSLKESGRSLNKVVSVE